MVVELAQDELRNLGKVWLTILVSLSYCYVIGKITSKGFTRLLAIIPVIICFLILPLYLTSIHFCGFTAFFISWLANFKLLLFAFGKPPLSSNPPISFPLFIAVSCLPIKIQLQHNPKSDQKPQNNSYPHQKSEIKQTPDQKTQSFSHPNHENSQKSEIKQTSGQKTQSFSHPNHENPQKSENEQTPDQKTQTFSHPHHGNSQKSEIEQTPDQKTQTFSPPSSQKLPWNYLIKGTLLIMMIKIYEFSDQLHQKLLWLVYCFHIYFGLEIILAIVAKVANSFLGLELEPQFNEPLLSTSLQDFWGRRWNLMVTSILRPTVYLPTRDYFSKFFGRKNASLPAVMATFIVSGIIHELIFYYLGRVRPTFQVTWFFLLHGFCLCVEIAVKDYGRERNWWVPPPWLSFVATASFVFGSGFWLFLPPLLEAGLDTRGLGEYAAIGAYVQRLLA